MIGLGDDMVHVSAIQETNALSPAEFAQFTQRLQPYCSASTIAPNIQIACDAIAARQAAEAGGGIGGFSSSDKTKLFLIGAGALLVLAVVMK